MSQYRILCVCLGNICRSPMAESVLINAIDSAGLSDAVSVDSAGTSEWHIGQGMDNRAAATLSANGYDTHHSARQVRLTDFDEYQLILTMDAANHADLVAMALDASLSQDHVRLFRSFDPQAPADAEVPDPYYGGQDGFDEVLQMTERASAGVVEFVRQELQ